MNIEEAEKLIVRNDQLWAESMRLMKQFRAALTPPEEITPDAYAALWKAGNWARNDDPAPPSELVKAAEDLLTHLYDAPTGQPPHEYVAALRSALDKVKP